MTIPHAFAFALAMLLVAGCAAFDPNNILSRRGASNEAFPDTPIAAPATLGTGGAGRMAAIEFVWSTVNDRYYDPRMNGVDWNAARERWQPRALAATDEDAFWDALDQMTGELRDAHTRVESPKRAAQIERFESISTGLAFRPVGGKLAVTSVNAESDAYWAGVRPGMTLEEVAGEPAQPAYAKALAETRLSSTESARHRSAARRLLLGESDTTAILTFARGDGTPFTVSLTRKRATTPPRVTHRVLPSGFGYIRLTSWQQSLQSRMIEAVEALKGTPGLVIDLRGNSGGSALMVRNVAAQFFRGKLEFGRSLTRTGKPITLAFDLIELVKVKQELEGTGLYLKPVVVLVDGASASGSELFAGLLQSQRRAAIVGQTSCGCLLAYMGYADIPGGGKLAYSEVGFVFPNGKRIEGEGVAPDVPVAVTIADLLVNRDRTLEEAQVRLKTLEPGKTVAHGKEKP